MNLTFTISQVALPLQLSQNLKTGGEGGVFMPFPTLWQSRLPLGPLPPTTLPEMAISSNSYLLFLQSTVGPLY